MSEKDVNRVLSHPFKATDEAAGLTKCLALIWRTMLKDYNIGLSEYGDLVSEYLRDARNKIPANPSKRNSFRSNLASTLFHVTGLMSFKTLCRGFMILKFTRLEFRITSWRELPDGTESEEGVEHFVKVRVRHPAKDKFQYQPREPQ